MTDIATKSDIGNKTGLEGPQISTVLDRDNKLKSIQYDCWTHQLWAGVTAVLILNKPCLLVELWAEFTSQFLQVQYPAYCTNKHFSSDLAQQQISTHGYTGPSVHCSTVGANYSSWRLWHGKIAWQIVPRSPQGSERDETDYEEISGNMALLAEETDRMFLFLSLLCLVVCMLDNNVQLLFYF